MGIICTCLPTVHTFVRRGMDKQKAKGEVNTLVVRDPNSGRLDPNVVPDSGYSSGENTNINLSTFDEESQVGDAASIQPAPSQKSLLVSVSRHED